MEHRSNSNCTRQWFMFGIYFRLYLYVPGSGHSGTFLLPGEPFGTDYQVVVDTVGGFAGEFGHIRTHGTALPMPPFSAKLLRVVTR